MGLTLVGYLVFGLMLFAGIFAQVLRRPWMVVRALLCGLAVLTLWSFLTWAWLPAALTPLALCSGALASVAYAHNGLRRALHRADHSYVVAL